MFWGRWQDFVYCITCVKDNNPEFVKKYKDCLSENPKIEDIQEHWNELIAADGGVG